MDGILNTLGNVLGAVMNAPGVVAMALFLTALAVMVVAVPAYAIHSVVGGMRNRGRA